MKTDSEEFRHILELTKSITQEYLSHNKGGNVVYLKEKIKDFLINPIWNVIEETFDLYYDQFIKNKSHIYEGKIRDYEKRLIEILIEAGKTKGQNAVFGSIIGYLLLHGSLTQTQLKELTGFSKGAISQTLKILSRTPAIKKESMEGVRENVYTFGATMADIASNIGSYKTESNELAIKFLESKTQELKKYKDKIGHDILSKRISDMINFFDYNVKLLDKINESSFIKELGVDETRL